MKQLIRVICLRWNDVKSRRSWDLMIRHIKLRKIANSEVKAARQSSLAHYQLLQQGKNSGM